MFSFRERRVGRKGGEFEMALRVVYDWVWCGVLVK
jgi:hypothetical protein